MDPPNTTMLIETCWVRSLPILPFTFGARRACITVEIELRLERPTSLPNLPDLQPFAKSIVSNKISQLNSTLDAGRKQFPAPFIDPQCASSEVRFKLNRVHTSGSESVLTPKARKIPCVALQEEHASTNITTAKCGVFFM